ncbi:MAG: hypothetical protein HGA54_00725, partial [Actinobacteria bacterium]|nr:hypothetical protein [Actinomycetota bacterium]
MIITQKTVHVSPWYAYPLELELLDNGDLFFTENTLCDISQIRKIEKLPTEFFVHQLQDINMNKVDSIKGFCEKWGVICAPYFQSKERFSTARENDPKSSRRRRSYQEMYSLDDSSAELGNELLKSTYSNAFNETCARFLERPVVKSENFRRQLCKLGVLSGGAISYEEVRSTLILIRDAIAIVSTLDFQNDFTALVDEFAQE